MASASASDPGARRILGSWLGSEGQSLKGEDAGKLVPGMGTEEASHGHSVIRAETEAHVPYV